MDTRQQKAVDQLIEAFIRDVCELPDRTSPEDDPDMLLVTGKELTGLLEDFAAEVFDLAQCGDCGGRGFHEPIPGGDRYACLLCGGTGKGTLGPDTTDGPSQQQPGVVLDRRYP